jgi:hypothetical protein
MAAVPRALPTSWPASVTPSQALGYLLARHVPIAQLPRGLTLIREAAGWRPRVVPASPGLGVHPLTVRAWLSAAREHAGVLGPPPGLIDLLAVLADELADPRVLADFGRWCGAGPGFEVRPRGPRRPNPPQAAPAETEPAEAEPAETAAEVVVPRAGELTRARTIVDLLMRRYGLSTVNRALERLAEAELRIDAGNDAQALRDLLGTGGFSAWLWPSRDVAAPLTVATTRLRGLGIAIPVEQLPVAVARTSLKRWPRVPGEWPLPVEAIRAWVNARADWRLTGDDTVEPVGPTSKPHRHDELIRSVLADRELTGAQLKQALTDAGMNPSTAGTAVHRSPLLRRRGRDRYLLIGER